MYHTSDSLHGMESPVELYHEFLNLMESTLYKDCVVSVSPSSSNHGHGHGHDASDQAGPESQTKAKSKPDGSSRRLHTTNTVNLDTPTPSGSTQSSISIPSHPHSILGPHQFLNPHIYNDKPAGLIYQRPQRPIPINHSPYPLTPGSPYGNIPYLDLSPSGIQAFRTTEKTMDYGDLPSYGYDEYEEDDDEDDNDYFGTHHALFNHSQESFTISNDPSTSSNPVVPGLFPQMNLGDDVRFMKFDTLPLTPSYVSR